MKTAVILGGGLAGLAAAHNLRNKFNVIIIEKEQQLGGLANSFYYNGKYVPRHYHHVFHHDNTTKKYLDKFGLLQDVVWKKNKMCICIGGQVYNFANPVGLLKFDYLSPRSRIKFGLFGLWATYVMNPKEIPDNLDAKAWLNGLVGEEITDKIFYHLQARNKFGIPLENISAKQFAHRLKEGEVMGKFGYPKYGLNSLIEGFEKPSSWNVLLKETEPTRVDVRKKAVFAKGDVIRYDVLINTLPVPEFLTIAEGLPQEYKEKWACVKYCPAVTVAFATDEFLTDHYWVNLINEPIHMIMQHSWLFDAYDVKISWALRYGGSGEDFKLTDEEIAAEYLDVVHRYFPEHNILWSYVFKEKYASPIYDKNYHNHKPDITTPGVPGLYHAGVAVTYPRIRNMNTALDSGEEVAKKVIEDESRIN